MRDMLYIDGQLVDLGDGVDITLNYKSNLLTDLGKIVGNNSYTIKLPKTMRNLGIIGISDIPSVVSSFPRVAHEARYFRNGIEIVSEGKAVLMGVSDAIEVVLTWGGTSALGKVVEDGRNINEFEYMTDYVIWETTVSPSVYNGIDKILYSDMHLWLNGVNDFPLLHPSVRSSYIFEKIKAVYGLEVEFPEERKEFIDSLIVPLLTRNGGYANRINNQGSVIHNASTNDISFVKLGEDFDSTFVVHTSLGGLYSIEVLVDCRVVIYPSFSSMFLGASLRYGSEDVYENTVYLPYDFTNLELDGMPSLTMYHYNKTVEVDLNAGDKFLLTAGIASTPTGINGTLFTYGAQPRQIKAGDKFPIIENLPDIKVIDFIKSIASLAGVFAVPVEGGDKIKFVTFDLLSDRSRAVDWSEKMIPLDYTNRPRNIGYTISDFAQNNRMLWREDDTVATWADGNILVGDNTLEYERDAVELPFAPTDTMFNKASIKLYEYNNSDEEPELQDVEPRLLVEKNVGGYSTGTFEGLHWSTLIAQYYETYQNAVKSPVVITEKVLLDELSLRDLDVSRPVYLRQYGKYYAVVELKAPSSGVCECKLLQLED